MLREVALYVGYAVLALGAVAGVVALFGALVWWLAGMAVKQWTSMDLFWSTCARIARERSDEKTRLRAQAEYEAQ